MQEAKEGTPEPLRTENEPGPLPSADVQVPSNDFLLAAAAEAKAPASAIAAPQAARQRSPQQSRRPAAKAPATTGPSVPRARPPKRRFTVRNAMRWMRQNQLYLYIAALCLLLIVAFVVLQKYQVA